MSKTKNSISNRSLSLIDKLQSPLDRDNNNNNNKKNNNNNDEIIIN